MENFEKNNLENNYHELDWDRFVKIADETISNKINPIINSLKESDFNMDDSRFSNRKVDKINEEIMDKYFNHLRGDEFEDIKEAVKRRILKLSMEYVAINDFGGSLSANERLEDEYLDILEEEGIFNSLRFLKINNIYDLNEYLEKLTDNLNDKNVLDNKKKGELFDRLKYRLEDYVVKNRA